MEALRDYTRSISEDHHHVKLATGFVKYCALLACSRGDVVTAAADAKQFAATTPAVERVLKSAVAAGATDDGVWASTLVDHQAMVAQFLELLRPATILGNLPGLRTIPFNTWAILQTGGTSAAWVGEQEPVPASAQAFTRYALTAKKVAALCVVTTELQRFADTAALASLQNDLIRAISAALDKSLIDPSLGATSNRPASVTHNVTPRHSTGSTISAISADLEAAAQSLIDRGSTLANAAWIMHPTTALTLSAMRGTTGDVPFPDVGVLGGSLLQMPVIVSAACEPSGSPGEYSIALVDGSRIIVADSGGLTVDASEQGAVQMSDAPSEGAYQLVSLWQNNLIGLRTTRFVSWQAMPDAVALIDNVTF